MNKVASKGNSRGTILGIYAKVEPMLKLLNRYIQYKKSQSKVDDIICSKKIFKKLTYGDFKK